MAEDGAQHLPCEGLGSAVAIVWPSYARHTGVQRRSSGCRHHCEQTRFATRLSLAWTPVLLLYFTALSKIFSRAHLQPSRDEHAACRAQLWHIVLNSMRNDSSKGLH